MTTTRRKALTGLGAGILAATAGRARAQAQPTDPAPACGSSKHVETGYERLQATNFQILNGHKVGLVANPTSVDRSLRHIADILHATQGVQLTAIFGPEHGFRGSAQAGSSEPRSTDPQTGITVFDIYNTAGNPLEKILKESGIDILLFDIQDVGARFYTYVWTLYDVMAACARLKIPVVVLDRPNPITALTPKGPVLKPKYASFVGRAPIALQHAMTIGELALFFHRYCLHPAGKAPHVVTMEGWSRDLFYDQTDLPWVSPSPNMPTLHTAIGYPGTCLFEGTVLSVGRGTALPFLQLGGPEVDARLWVDAARAMNLPGVLFRETWFTPSTSVDRDTLVHGLNVVITDRTCFDALSTSLALLCAARPLCQGPFWRDDGRPFDQLSGDDSLRKAIDNGARGEEITATWQADLSTFGTRRKDVLLYHT